MCCLLTVRLNEPTDLCSSLRRSPFPDQALPHYKRLLTHRAASVLAEAFWRVREYFQHHEHQLMPGVKHFGLVFFFCYILCESSFEVYHSISEVKPKLRTLSVPDPTHFVLCRCPKSITPHTSLGGVAAVIYGRAANATPPG